MAIFLSGIFSKDPFSIPSQTFHNIAKLEALSIWKKGDVETKYKSYTFRSQEKDKQHFLEMISKVNLWPLRQRQIRLWRIRELVTHPLWSPSGWDLSFDTESQDEVQGEPLSFKEKRGGNRSEFFCPANGSTSFDFAQDKSLTIKGGVVWSQDPEFGAYIGARYVFGHYKKRWDFWARLLSRAFVWSDLPKWFFSQRHQKFSWQILKKTFFT